MQWYVQFFSTAMVRATPTQLLFDLDNKIEFETNISGGGGGGIMFTRAFGRRSWKRSLTCKKDDREEAEEHDENAIGVYKTKTEDGNILVGQSLAN